MEGVLEEDDSIAAADEFDEIRRSSFPKRATAEDDAWNALYCAIHRRWRSSFLESFARRRWDVAAAVARDASSYQVTELNRSDAALLRDLFGNPFRPLILEPHWRTPPVLALAQAAYEERLLPDGTLDNGRLAVLADALEDAGCSEVDILDHLRGSAIHVRGCHVVDALLGKM